VPLPDGIVAVAVTVALAALAVVLFRRFLPEKQFVTNVFLLGLGLRMTFGLLVHLGDWRQFFGGDAITYNFNGSALIDHWLYNVPLSDDLIYQTSLEASTGWGMNYFVAAIYYVLGKNIFAAQSICAVFGAATAPLVYSCARTIYKNENVARTAAVAIAIFPSFVIWSGQLLKDGLLVFMIVLAMTMVMALQKQFSITALIILLVCMFNILTLRFYVFYIVFLATAGSFIVGASASHVSILRRTVILALLASGLIYFGIARKASQEFDRYGSLERIQLGRTDLMRSASSGFGEDVDVSTTSGALWAIPVGFAYLMFAPFPWQTSNLRQAIPIPEVLLWWAMIPFLVSGLIYSVKNRLRDALPILLFSLLLTISYSIFQGNVGTAYRQRTQIQVFLFMFIAVGWTLRKEQKENERLLRAATQRHINESVRGRLRPTSQV